MLTPTLLVVEDDDDLAVGLAEVAQLLRVWRRPCTFCVKNHLPQAALDALGLNEVCTHIRLLGCSGSASVALDQGNPCVLAVDIEDHPLLQRLSVGSNVLSISINGSPSLQRITISADEAMTHVLRITSCGSFLLGNRQLQPFKQLAHLYLEDLQNINSLAPLSDVKATLVGVSLFNISNTMNDCSAWHFHDCRVLSTISLYNCPHVDELCVTQCPNLQQLSISHCAALRTLRVGRVDGPSTINGQAALDSLTCITCPLSQLSLSGLALLRSFTLSDTEVEEVHVCGDTCPDLALINLSNNGTLSGSRCILAGEFSALTELDLSANSFTSMPITGVMHSLQRLDLGGNILRYPLDLTGYPSLIFLDVSYNIEPSLNMGGGPFCLYVRVCSTTAAAAGTPHGLHVRGDNFWVVPEDAVIPANHMPIPSGLLVMRGSGLALPPG